MNDNSRQALNPEQCSTPIALIDDDEVLNGMLADYLQGEGFAVSCFVDGEEALNAIHETTPFQAIVLDIMMPKVNGLDVLKQLRQRIHIPIIMVTGRGDDIDKILGLEMGADDYIAKPCNPRELLARLRAVLRRSQVEVNNSNHQNTQTLCLRGVTLNASRREVTIAHQPLALTSVEFNILHILMQHAGQPVSKDTLSLDVLHRTLSAYDRSIDVHVSRIRKKLETSMGSPEPLIKTLRGQGYVFIP